jgi:hypothetical protein
MPVILALTEARGIIYGAGPDGLFALEKGALRAVLQPMATLYTCAVVGDLLLTGGAPHGVASRNLNLPEDTQWQGGWMDHTTTPVLALAPAPGSAESGLLLAATAGDGILRSTNRGVSWTLCNYGLLDHVILSMAWAPAPKGDSWLDRQIVFAGSESALYRSPAAGLAWKRVDSMPQGAVQALAISPHFHSDGVVLAGTESSGIWRSQDGGRTFARVEGGPQHVEALLALTNGWLAGTAEGMWESVDGVAWQRAADSAAALCLLHSGGAIYVGDEKGIRVYEPSLHAQRA